MIADLGLERRGNGVAAWARKAGAEIGLRNKKATRSCGPGGWEKLTVVMSQWENRLRTRQ